MISKIKELNSKKIIIIAFCIIILLSLYTSKTYKSNNINQEKSISTDNNVYLNSEYVEYVKSYNDKDKSTWNVIPRKYVVETENKAITNPIANLYTSNNNSRLFNSDTPLLSNFSLLNESCGTDSEGNTIPCSGIVKNQGQEDLCWTYATNSSIETNLLLQNKNYLMSQKQLDYSLANPVNSIIEGINPYYNHMIELSPTYTRELNDGGNFVMANISLNSGFSPVYEETFFNLVKEHDTEYNWNALTEIPTTGKYLKPQAINDVLNSDNVNYAVTEYYDYPYLDYFDMDQYPNDGIPDTRKQERINLLKENIQQYGSVYISTVSPDYNAGTCYDKDSNTVIRKGENKCGGYKDTGHAMSIIGWDDNYSYKDPATNEIGTGAWILKNSWGTSNPYSYLAYTSRYTEVVTIKTVEEKNWDRVYDMVSKRNRTKIDSKTETYKYYKSSNLETVKHISFENKTLQNATYKFYLSTNDGETYELISTLTAPMPGKYKLQLDDQITLNNDFIIKVDYTEANTNIFDRNSYTEDQLFVYTKTTENSNYVETNFDNTIYMNLDNKYTIDTYVSNQIKSVNYAIQNSEGLDVTNEFIITNTFLLKGIATPTLSFKDLNNYSNYVGSNYKLITTGEYLDGEETKYITYENNFNIDIQRAEEIVVSTDNIKLYKGYNKIINHYVLPKNALIQEVEYELDYNYLSRNDNIIIPVNEGQTQIILKTMDGSNTTKSINVTIENNLTEIASLNSITNLKGGYKLSKDITIDTGIAENFEGTFDGNGHTIYFNSSDISLFTSIKNANIKNINIAEAKNVIVKLIRDKSFGALSINVDDSIIMNVGNSVNLYDWSNNYYIGGLIGELNDSILENSYNDGNIKTTEFSGGLVGKAINSKIKNIFNSGNFIHMNYNVNPYRGGIVAEGDNVLIENAYNIGNFSYVVGEKSIVLESGSIMGIGINDSKIENAYTLSFLKDAVINNDMEKPTIINFQKYTMEEMKDEINYSGFDFNNVWKLDDNTIPFPILRNIDFLTTSNENVTEYNGGTGKIWNPYKISTPEQLNNIRKKSWITEASNTGSVFILENDIDMTHNTQDSDGAYYNDGKGWTPLLYFIGIFNGNHKKIKGLKTKTSGDVGLFNTLYNSYIYDLGMENSNIESTYGSLSGAGGIAGKANNTIIEGCYTTGNIDTKAWVGAGIIGLSEDNVTIRNSYNSSNVYSNTSYTDTSGITNINGKDILIENSYNTGDISSLGGDGNASGIAAGYSGKATIKNSYNTGNINSSKFSTGIGYLPEYSVIENSYNTGDVIANGNAFGIGKINSNALIKNTYNTGYITSGMTAFMIAAVGPNSTIENSYNVGIGQTNSVYICRKWYDTNQNVEIKNIYNLQNTRINKNGEIIANSSDKTIEQMKTQNIYTGFDFANDWEIKNVGAYPTLKSNPYTYAVNMDTQTNTIIVKKDIQNTIQPEIFTFAPTDTTNKNISIVSNNDKLTIEDNKISIADDAEIGIYNNALTIKTNDGSRLTKELNVNIVDYDYSVSTTKLDFDPIYNYTGGTVKTAVTLNNLDTSDIQYVITKNNDITNTNLKNYFTITQGTIETNNTTKTFNLDINVPINNPNITSGIYSVKLIGGGCVESNIITFTIEDFIHVDNITLNKTNTTIKIGSNENLTVNFNPTDSTNKNITWTSSNPTIASIDQTGKVTGLLEGISIITATTEDGKKTATCTVTITKPILTLLTKTIVGNSSYDTTKIYKGYGGTITQNITKKDITGDLTVKVKNSSNIDKTSDFSIEQTDNLVKVIVNNNSNIETVTYTVELSHPTIITKTFDFNIEEIPENPISIKNPTEIGYRIETDGNNNYIKNIIISKKGIAGNEFLNNFNMIGTPTLHKNDDSIINDTTTKIGTGMKLKINDKNYIMIVNGDVNGNGNIDIFDYIKIMNHIMNSEKRLSGIYYEAADITNDNSVGIFDYIRIMNILK